MKAKNTVVHYRYIVWTDYGTEGWNITKETDDFTEAVIAREESMANGNGNVLVTEYIPLIIGDGRHVND